MLTQKPEEDGKEVEDKKLKEVETSGSELPTGLEAQELAAQHDAVEVGGGGQFELPVDEVAYEINDTRSNDEHAAS